MVKQQPQDPQSSRVWNPPGLVAYVRDLEGKHRNTGLRGNDILHILVGHRGPWLSKKAEAENIVFIRNQLAQLREDSAQLARRRKDNVRHNRWVGALKAQVTGRVLLFAHEKRALLAALDAVKRELPPKQIKARPRSITRSPSSKESGQGFWDPLIVHLVEYLERTTTKLGELTRCQIASEILHLASEGAFPRGAARVKQRYYRTL